MKILEKKINIAPNNKKALKSMNASCEPKLHPKKIAKSQKRAKNRDIFS